MIQRIQSVYLLVAVVIGMVHFLAWPLFAIQIFASAVSLIAVFMYRNRPRQAMLCLLACVADIIWYVVLAVLIQQGGQTVATLPLTACLPLIAAILCLIARRAVLADEKLVRAADRIR